MKRTILFMSMAAALLFAACQKEQGTKTLSLTASLEQQEDGTKTALNGGFVAWSKDDAINVFTDQSENVQMTLKSGAGTTAGTFSTTTEVTGHPTYAIYPYAAGNTISGSTITFNLPETQKYVPNTFDNGVNVAVAQVTSNGMQFKNVCGVLKLQLRGIGKVTKIELTGNNDEYLWGTYTADANTASSNAAIYSSGGGKVLTLDCSSYGESTPGAKDGGVFLSLSSNALFYIVVPAGVFGNETKGGFNAKCCQNDIVLCDINTDEKSNIINRSKVRAMPTKIINPLPSTYCPLKFLQSSGKQWINTGLTVDASYEYLISILDLKKGYDAGVFGNDGFLYGFRFFNDVGLQYVNGAFSMLICDNVPSYVSGDFRINTSSVYSSEGYNFRYRSDTENKMSGTLKLFKAKGVCSSCKILQFIVSSNNIVKLALAPAMRKSDSKLGMYDIITGNFFMNAGSDEFIAGPELTD